MRLLAATLVALVSMVGLTMVLAAPETLDHRIPPGYQPEIDEDEIGLWAEFEELEARINKSALLIRDPAINEYMNGIVCRVAAEYCEDFRVYIIRNPHFNASMTATGMMQIWTGLIVRASSTDEIAAVIAHEIAHYTRLHSLEGFRALRRKMATGAFFDIGLTALTGIYGLGQAAAVTNFLAFNRKQETEADLLGLKLLTQAQYDPHASYRVWQQIIAEEEAAAVKAEKPGIFARTHPDSKARMSYLKARVESHHGPQETEATSDTQFLNVLSENYLILMEDQIQTNRFGRTEEILRRHAEIGVEPSLVQYFLGEMFRQRNEEGDNERAKNAYLDSVERGKPPAAAYKNLGYLSLKKDEVNEARAYFRQYLALDPDASDRAMIEFYLEE